MATAIVSKLVVFSILINFSAAILLVGVVNSDGEPIFTNVNMGPTIYEGESHADDLTLNLEQDISPSGSIDDRGDQIYRILETIGLGFILKFLEAINQYMFGFIDMLSMMIGSYLEESIRELLFGSSTTGFGLLKTILLIAYTLYGISMLTGRNVVEGY